MNGRSRTARTALAATAHARRDTSFAGIGAEGPATAEVIPLIPGQFAILRAVAAGRVEITCSRRPDLYVDGMPCCNQLTAHHLVRAGHLRPVRPGQIGERVAATLTASGLAALDAATPAANEAA